MRRRIVVVAVLSLVAGVGLGMARSSSDSEQSLAFTQSPDGQTIYVWKVMSVMNPEQRVPWMTQVMYLGTGSTTLGHSRNWAGTLPPKDGARVGDWHVETQPLGKFNFPSTYWYEHELAEPPPSPEPPQSVVK